MRFWLLSASLIAVITAETCGQDAKPVQAVSYPITLKADEVREFVPLKVDYAGLQLSSTGVSGIPINTEPGVTGLVLIGNGTFRFAPDDAQPIEGDFRAAMLRFNPKNQKEILPFDRQPPTTDRAVQEMSNHLLKESFRRCWHSGLDALIPDEGALAAVVFSREHGELLISVSSDSTVVYSFSDRKKLYETRDRKVAAVLQSMNGQQVAGSLRPTDAPRRLRWQAIGSTTPVDYDVESVNFIRFPVSAHAHRHEGQYCFEMAGGDIVFGDIVDLGEAHAVLDLSRFGRMKVRRSAIRQIHRQGKGTGLVYAGPDGLADWAMASPGKEWQEERGLVFTERGGGWLVGDFGLPPRAVVEVEVSWRTGPAFALALGGDPKSGVFNQAFRIEVWDESIVLFRELDFDADAVPVERVAAGPGRVRLSICLDQVAGRCLIYSDAGKLQADMKVGAGKAPVLSGLRLSNVRGDVRLERLKISHWNGSPRDAVSADRPHVQNQDGSILMGVPVRYDASAGEFVVRTETGESRVSAGGIAGLTLGVPEDAKPRSTAAIYQDGARLTGDLVKVDEQSIWLSGTVVGEEVRLPIAGLRSLIVMRH
jgi:hypothetical protein